MADGPTTLGSVIDKHFKSELTVDFIGDMPIKITNEPHFDKKTFTVVAEGVVGSQGYRLFPSANLFLEDINLTLNFKKNASSGKITGVLLRDDCCIEIKIILTPNAVEKLCGKLSKKSHPFGLPEAMSFLGIREPLPGWLGTPKDVDLVSLGIVADFEARSIKLTGNTAAGNGGTLFAQERDDGNWQFALLFDRSKKWKAADLASGLRPIDDFVGFNAAFLGFASHDGIRITGDIHGPLGKHTLDMQKGLNIAMDVSLSSGKASALAKAIHGTFHVTDMFLAAQIGTSLDSITLQTALGDLAFQLKGGGDFTIKSAELKFHPIGKPEVHLDGHVNFPVSAKKRLDVFGSITVSPDELSFGGEVDGLNLKIVNDLVLEDARAQFGLRDGSPFVGFGGDIDIDHRTHLATDAQLQIPSFAPLMYSVDVENVDLQPVFEAIFRKKKLPAPLRRAIWIHEVKLWNCFPGNCSIASQTVNGSGFIGKALLFGFETDIEAKITTSGFCGTLSIDKPIDHNTTGVPGFTISDLSRHKGPHAKLDTTSKTPLDASVWMDVFGVGAGAKIGANGFEIKAKNVKFGKLGTWSVSASLQKKGKKYSGDLSCRGKFKDNPVKIHIAGYEVRITSVAVDLSPKGFQYTITGGAYNKLGVRVRKIDKTDLVHFGEIGNELTKLGDVIAKKIKP